MDLHFNSFELLRIFYFWELRACNVCKEESPLAISRHAWLRYYLERLTMNRNDWRLVRRDAMIVTITMSRHNWRRLRRAAMISE
jgi:hypothetical protein